MWNEVKSIIELNEFLDKINRFHDSCLTKLNYVSGAYVDEKCNMHPLNDERKLLVILHQQNETHPIIELEFTNLQFMKLCPINPLYTCEITCATMSYQDGLFIWSDSENPNTDIEKIEGTIICAEKFRWRQKEDFLCNQNEKYGQQ